MDKDFVDKNIPEIFWPDFSLICVNSHSRDPSLANQMQKWKSRKMNSFEQSTFVGGTLSSVEVVQSILEAQMISYHDHSMFSLHAD